MHRGVLFTKRTESLQHGSTWRLISYSVSLFSILFGCMERFTRKLHKKKKQIVKFRNK